MDLINRTLLTLRPNENFLEWLHQTSEENAKVEEEELWEDSNAYLIKEVDSESDLEEILKSRYQELFVAELSDWVEDDQLWPEDLSFETFCEYFQVEVQTVVIDLVDSPINKEEY
jgi:hypothetical protein